MSGRNRRGPLLDHQVGATLTEGLISVADEIRGLYTEFGLRPYRVFLVWVQWVRDEDGDNRVGIEREIRDQDQTDLTALAEVDLEAEVGVGRPVLLREIELLPTPLVGSLSGVGEDQEAMGLTERGGITVTQISMRHSEDLLMGLLSPYRDPDNPSALLPGIEFFWEVQENRPPGHRVPGEHGIDSTHELRSPRRRFHVASVPTREADSFQWVVSLERVDGERGREAQTQLMDGGLIEDEF